MDQAYYAQPEEALARGLATHAVPQIHDLANINEQKDQLQGYPSISSAPQPQVHPYPAPAYPPPSLPQDYLFHQHYNGYSYGPLETPELRPDSGSPLDYQPTVGLPMTVSSPPGVAHYPRYPMASQPTTPGNLLSTLSPHPYIAPIADYFPQPQYHRYPGPDQWHTSMQIYPSTPPVDNYPQQAYSFLPQMSHTPYDTPSLTQTSYFADLHLPTTQAPTESLYVAQPAVKPPAPIRRASTKAKGKQAAQPAAADRKKSVKRIAREVQVACHSCLKPFAKLIKRGTVAELDLSHSLSFTCTDCTINESSLDLMALAAPAAAPSRPKRGRSNDQWNSNAICDVCHKSIGTGGCTMDDAEVEQTFSIEIICTHCNNTYKRCTDCGAGGGKRIGVGKWRAKELFEGERKTCSLLHYRQSSFTELENVVSDVLDVDPTDLAKINELCGKVQEQNVLSNFAIPEIMESDEAKHTAFPLSSFHNIKGMAIGSWQALSTYLGPVPFVPNATRYIAAKWCKPLPRKTGAQPSASRHLLTAKPSALLRSDKEFVGFGLAEYDHSTGTLYVPLLSPWTNNDGFEPTLDLLEDLLEHIDQRVEKQIHCLYQQGRFEEAKATPRVTHVFTMVPYLRDSRIVNYMAKKRAFVTLEDYLQHYPETPVELFPPHRPVHLPPDRQAMFTVLCKRYIPERDKGGSKIRTMARCRADQGATASTSNM